jgi:hypothetical protein
MVSLDVEVSRQPDGACEWVLADECCAGHPSSCVVDYHDSRPAATSFPPVTLAALAPSFDIQYSKCNSYIRQIHVRSRAPTTSRETVNGICALPALTQRTASYYQLVTCAFSTPRPHTASPHSSRERLRGQGVRGAARAADTVRKGHLRVCEREPSVRRGCFGQRSLSRGDAPVTSGDCVC